MRYLTKYWYNKLQKGVSNFTKEENEWFELIDKLYEEETEYIVNKSANSIIKENCEFYGSSYEGRCIGTKNLTGIKTK